jgi:hypothetical protein
MNRGRLAAAVRIACRLKPSAEGFAAAAAVYCPDLLLQLAQVESRAVRGNAEEILGGGCQVIVEDREVALRDDVVNVHRDGLAPVTGQGR